MAEKVDFKQSLPGYRAVKGRFDVVDLPPRQYLMLDGSGDPNTSPAFAEALETIYPVAYALKFASKKDLGRDYVVPPLEALWWAEDLSRFTARDKGSWQWTVMLMLPDWLGEAHYQTAIEAVQARGKATRLSDLRRETLDEGACLQTLHVGSFDDEGPVIGELHRRITDEMGAALTGIHHEIYLSDFRRVAPEKLRTILRQPLVRSVSASTTNASVSSANGESKPK